MCIIVYAYKTPTNGKPFKRPIYTGPTPTRMQASIIPDVTPGYAPIYTQRMFVFKQPRWDKWHVHASYPQEMMLLPFLSRSYAGSVGLNSRWDWVACAMHRALIPFPPFSLFFFFMSFFPAASFFILFFLPPRLPPLVFSQMFNFFINLILVFTLLNRTFYLQNI